MRKLLIFITIVSTFLFGCLNTEEELTIDANGSGVYKNSVDLSGLLDMMEMMSSMDTSADAGLKKLSEKNIDSTVEFKSFVDTVASLTNEQKKLFEKATVRIQMNQQEKAFKLTMSYPFSELDDLQKLIELQQSDKLPNPLQQSMGNEVPPGSGRLPSIDKIMKMRFTNGLIERKIDQEKLADLKNSEQFKEAGQMDDMMQSITFSSTFNLPKAAKNISGEKLKLSDDKKTATINYTLLDVIKSPSSLEYKIEY